MVVFRGIAHGPARQDRAHPSDLSPGELEATQMGGLPLHVEHRTDESPVGHVLSSYTGGRGELRVIAKVEDPATAQEVRNGSLRGLSLGTDCVASMNGDVLSRSQKRSCRCAPRVDARARGSRTSTGSRCTRYTISRAQVRAVFCVSANITSRSKPRSKGARAAAKRGESPRSAFSLSCAMAEATPSDVADSVTKQTYEETKALAEERAAKLATAEARLQAYERARARSAPELPAGDAGVHQGDFHRVFDAGD